MSYSGGYSEPVPLDELPSDADPRDDEARLWIGNIDSRITEFNMLKIMQKYGSLKKLDFLYNKLGPDKGKPRGYCFVTYTSKESAERAKKALHGKVALSKKLSVRAAHVPCQSSAPENKPKESSSAEEKIRAIEKKLKSMEQNKDEFSIATAELPVVIRQKQTPKYNTAGQSKHNTAGQSKHSGPYRKTAHR